MITLTAQIELKNKENSKLLSASSNIIGSVDINSVVNKTPQATIGEEFVGVEVSNDEGKFENAYNISLFNTNATSFKIAFSSQQNAYPKKIEVYKKTEKETFENIEVEQSAGKRVFSDEQEEYDWSPFFVKDGTLYLRIYFPLDNSIGETADFYLELGTYIYLYYKNNETSYLQFSGYTEYDRNAGYEFLEEDEGVVEGFIGIKVPIIVGDGYSKVDSLSGENEYGEPTSYIDRYSGIEIPFKDFIYARTSNTAFITYEKRTITTELEKISEFSQSSHIWQLEGLPVLDEYILSISDWRKPNSPLIISGIYLDANYINIDYRNIISISRSIFDRGDLKFPSFGIISNIGEIEFNDLDGVVLNSATNLLLQSGLKCEITLKNTLVKDANEKIALLQTDEWDYDNENKTVRVTLKDDLEEWQNINVEGINYDGDISVNLKWYYNHLRNITVKNGNYKVRSFEELDTKTQDILNYTFIKARLLYAGTLWASWEKICEVGQLHIYKENGIVECRYNGGN